MKIVNIVPCLSIVFLHHLYKKLRTPLRDQGATTLQLAINSYFFIQKFGVLAYSVHCESLMA